MTWDWTQNSCVLLSPSFIHALKSLTSSVRYPFRIPAASCCPSDSFCGLFFQLLASKSFTLCVLCHLIAQLTYSLYQCIRPFTVDEWSNICKDTRMLPSLASSSLSVVQKPILIFAELPDWAELLKSWAECGLGLVWGSRSVCAVVRIYWGKTRKYSIWILDLKDAVWAVRLLNASHIN